MNDFSFSAEASVNPAELAALSAMIRAGTPLITIECHDEPQAMTLFSELRRQMSRPLLKWTAATGLVWVEREQTLAAEFADPEKALEHLRQRPDRGIYLLMDFHHYLNDPVVVRHLREMSRQDDGANPRTVVLISPSLKLPAELERQARCFRIAPPDRQTLKQMVREEAQRWEKQRGSGGAAICEQALERLLTNLEGLTLKDARRLARNAIFDDGALDEDDLPDVMQAKFELLNPGGILNFELETARFSQIAGMPRLRQWLETRASVFAAAEPPPGLDMPRGMLLLGVQGCGKSLAARAAAGLFGVPLLHLDCGALFNRFHGESERNLRESLQAAELMAPCVLWIDEIEKGLAVSDTDGGTSRRMLGTLLTWMAEHRSRVFIAATANDISILPPELVRKGRFDEIFFVDLPDEKIRAEILAIHFHRRELKPQLYPLDDIARATEGFSGAELEHLVVAALYVAHARGEPLTTDDLMNEIHNTRPLSVTMAEPITELRQWAANRAVAA
ncbi:AAA family ATPase [Wenzhouxiangella sp. AB-CW3]|uniref:AAA family ATPase n=1 Tax=Wenzhouxiangella sp. AB-CW3 TaxID=2771012 RepID=UPI001CC32E4E|nr:AAA family ATPase [Wenzhouxiangella sp. AB-CW3]